MPNKDLNVVSGGQIVELKNGKWMTVPNNAPMFDIVELKNGKWMSIPVNTPMFDTEAEAKAAEQSEEAIYGNYGKPYTPC